MAVSAELARALAFEDALINHAAEMHPFRWGSAVFTPAVPDIYDRNLIRFTSDDPSITADALAAECDRLMIPGGFTHRKVVVHDEVVGARLAAGFAAMKWRVTKLLWMVHRSSPEGDPPGPAGSHNVDEIADAVHTAAKDEFNRRDPYLVGEKVLNQMRDVAGLVGVATDKRCFAAYVDGTIASVCELYSDKVTAQIEDVATLEEYRGRGLATAVVGRGLWEALQWDHEMIFLVADDDDWPKELYAKLGFEAMGRTYQFLLSPDHPPVPKS